MRRALPITALTALIALTLASPLPASAAFRTQPAGPSGTVTIVLAPYLTFADITPTHTPAIYRLAQNDAVGAVNARSRVREIALPASPLEGALALSAGDWPQPDYTAAPALSASESFQDASATVAYRRATGRSPGSAQIMYAGIAAQDRSNSAKELDVVLGTLGGAVRAAGGSTVAVGNSDSGLTSDVMKYQRPAGVAAMDERGLTQFGDVSRDLLRPSPNAPYGVETDIGAFGKAYVKAREAAGSGPTLVVMDPGDLYRAKRFAWSASEEEAARQHAAAVRKLDDVVDLAVRSSTPRDSIIVVAQAQGYDEQGDIEGLGPVVLGRAGRTNTGAMLTSSSTHRVGIVTNLDITATALDMLGITPPVQVVGDPVRLAEDSRTLDQKLAYLQKRSNTAVAVDTVRPGVLDTYIWFVTILVAVGTVFVATRERWGAYALQAASVLRVLALFALAVPVSGWLMFLFLPDPQTSLIAVLMLLAWAVVLTVFAWFVARGWGFSAGIAKLTALTAIVLCADQFFGAPLSYVGFFSYSPLLAARFYGLGNEASGAAVGAALVAVAVTVDWMRDRGMKSADAVARWAVPATGLCVIVCAAAPMLGANVGVAIWGSAGFIVAWVLMNGYRLTWKTALVALLVVVVLIGAFAAVDLMGKGSQTHLARSLNSAKQGGADQLWIIAARKMQTNVRVLSHTNWTWALAAVLGMLAFMRLRTKPDFTDLLAQSPALGAAIAAAIVAGIIAFLTEDSGIVVPALIMLYPGLAVLGLLVTGSAGER